MSDTPLRQPLTFWQWITSQPGTLFVPPPPPLPPQPHVPPPPPTIMQVLNHELERVHGQIDSFRDQNDCGDCDDHIQNLVSRLDKLHDELARRSKEESKK